MICAPSSPAFANFTFVSAGFPYTKASEPSSSTTSTSTWKPSLSGVKPSGRTPTVTSLPADAGTAMPRFPSIALPPTIGALSKFMAGEPINPATKAFAGLS